VVETTHAHVLLASGDARSALAAAEEAVRLLPGNEPAWTRYAADARLLRGDALAALHRRDEARSSWSEARGIIEPVARTATDPQLIDTWTRTLIRLGEADQATSLLQRLTAVGYRPLDLLDIVKQSRVAAEGE